MNPTIQSFYIEFYGSKFVRHFRAPTDLKTKKLNPGNQVIIEDTRKLWLHVHKRSGLWPCYVHIYDHGLLGNLKRQDPEHMMYDRVFFDFDIHHEQSHQIKKRLQNLRGHGLKHKEDQQDELREQLRKSIIDEHIAEPAINEAKDFSIKFKDSFGSYPLLFFSGGKGCHAYTFFEPIKGVNINRALSWFGEKIKVTYNYITLDLSVLVDPKSRLSRVPYSKHQYTGFAVVPFTIHDSYDVIIEKSLNPVVETFQKEDYFSSFGSHLKTIDPILKHNEEIRKNKEVVERAKWGNKENFKSFNGVDDHRDYFKKLLGPPRSEHPDKEYVMYCCPFPNHQDNKPSFKVHRTGYECYGCGKKGNLARKKDFLEFKKTMGNIEL
ncbi:hypothetical protein KTG15_09210 [Methanobacterium sp. YSL]|nr:hypothetical protein [Methanobacterium sp. YSL]